MATRVRFVVCRSERQGSADLECAAAGRYGRWRRGGDGGPGVAVSLARVSATRYGCPRQRVELGRVEAEHVAGADGDQLVCHERQLLEAEFGRPEERLADQRVVVQCGRCGMLVMMVVMLSRALSDATVESIYRSPNLPRCTNNAIILQLQIMLLYFGFKQQRLRQENSSGGGASFSFGADPAPSLPHLSPPPSLPSPPLPFPPFPSRPFPSLPLRSRPRKIQLGGLRERCKLPQRGLGPSPSRQTILCILALKSDIWWQQF